MDLEVKLLLIFIALIGVAVSFGATVLGLFAMGPAGLLVILGGALARSRLALAVGGVMLSGPLIYLGLALTI